jgi:hypothetical protein
VGDEGVAEADAAGREPVELRTLQEREVGLVAKFALDHTECVVAVVVGDDDNDVRAGRENRGGENDG